MVTTPLMTCQRCERGLVVVLDRATWDASIAATAPRQSMSGRRSQSWWSPDHIGAATGGRDLPLLHLLARVDDADFRDANGHGLQLRLRPPCSWLLSSAAYLPLRFHR